jgi:hypothetical protein
MMEIDEFGGFAADQGVQRAFFLNARFRQSVWEQSAKLFPHLLDLAVTCSFDGIPRSHPYPPNGDSSNYVPTTADFPAAKFSLCSG